MDIATKPNFVIKNNYHDSQLVSFVIGPRRECSLNILLDGVWNAADGKSVSIRFGAIKNFEEVNNFFEKVGAEFRSDRYISGILSLECPERNAMRVNFDKYGELMILCEKFSES